MSEFKQEEEFKTIYQRLKPAQETQEHIHRSEIKFDNIENTMDELNTNFLLMKKDIESICSRIEETNVQNKEEHRAIMARLGRIEKFALGTLVIFALASLYFLFTKAGLPSP